MKWHCTGWRLDILAEVFLEPLLFPIIDLLLYVLNRRVGGLVCFDVDSEGILALAETLKEGE